MRISYVGKKPSQEDVIAGSGVPWVPGEVREIEDVEVCAQLLRHTDSWALAPASESLVSGNYVVDESGFKLADGVLEVNNASMPDSDIDALRAQCAAAGIKFHPNAKAEALRKKLAEVAQ
jgi:hypothetical protein